MTPIRHRFLVHNRLLVALPNTTIVVEAGVRSGTLHTARQAYDLGRNAGAILGPVTSATSIGPYQLIGDGRIRIVIDAGQITHMLQMHEVLHKSPQRSPPGLTFSRDHAHRDLKRDTPSL